MMCTAMMCTAVAVRVGVEAAQPAETANVNATPSASACHRLRATNFNPLTPLCRIFGFSATRLASADSRAIRNNRGEARGYLPTAPCCRGNTPITATDPGGCRCRARKRRSNRASEKPRQFIARSMARAVARDRCIACGCNRAHAGNDTVAGQVCVVGKGRQGSPRVIYEPVAPPAPATPSPARP